MSSLHLAIRTPVSTIFEGPVQRVRAEDLDGWFGIRPGRRDLAAVLPAGLLLFEDEAGEAFLALAGGLLDLRGERCRVMAREAILARQLEEIAGLVENHTRARQQRTAKQRDVFDDLAKEALRRLARQELSQ
jgi:F-type H+-transporting ATPase subunit epsilon